MLVQQNLVVESLDGRKVTVAFVRLSALVTHQGSRCV